MDVDGNTYPVVSIGNQCWMAANLKTTRYRDGAEIPNVTVDSDWVQLTSGAWCNYENNPVNDTTYGKLYNWYAASNPNICPLGWHVPTDAEWQQLEEALGMPAEELTTLGSRGSSQNVGGKMKSSLLWNSPNAGANNESGFSGLPGGALYDYSTYGLFSGLGSFGNWWSTTAAGTVSAWHRSLLYDDGSINRNFYVQPTGFCLRCLQD